MKSNLSGVKSLLTLCALTISITPYWQHKALAQENFSPISVTAPQVTFNPPAGKRPKTSQAGASRSIGKCINQAENADVPFSPLLPVSAQGLTVAAHPTVLAYLPQTSAQKVFFSWRDENNNDHYQAIIPINNRGGIISLTLPEDAPPLEVGKNYQWSLAIMCNGQLQPDSPIIQAQIRRVAIAATVSDRLKNANPLETAAIYGEAGIWYETVATLAQLTTAQPDNQNLASNWEDLLTSVGLEKISQVPTMFEK
ncbi:MAG: DUF928 domain-containing protein [Xenococcus sp. MO_188.B8]|nr:DUF928 domain-containing protein [Xenococcus sp. MO_188.B8]